MLEAWGLDKRDLILISLGTIASILAISVIASIIAGPKEPLDHPPEIVVEGNGPPVQLQAELPPSLTPPSQSPGE
jgi:hypothetical protein